VIDVPIVAADRVPESERAHFPVTSASVTELPREPVPGAETCVIDERIDHMDLDFTTTCPGQPHIISVAYYPNWRVEGASAVFLVSPAFMLVFPDGPHVHLSYRRIPVDWVGIALSLIGIAICVAARHRAPAAEPAGSVARRLTGLQPLIVGVVVAALLAATLANAARQHLPQYFYQRGWKAFNANQFADAERYYQRAAWFGGDTSTAADATFFRGHSLARLGRFDDAIAQYEEVIARHPDSTWWVESRYQIGLCLRQLGRRADAARRFQEVIDNWPGTRWANESARQLQQMRAEPGGLGS
jgi:hypothetical protein